MFTSLFKRARKLINLNKAQISLILSLVESEKIDLIADLQTENFIDGERFGLTKTSLTILERRFWELAAIQNLLTDTKPTASPKDANH